MRLFAAIPLPDEARERLLQLRLRLASPKDGLRWSQPEQWHTTLRFFGDVEEATAATLQTSLHGLRASAVEMRLPELGWFQAKGILFAGVTPTPELLTLQAEVEQLASRAGLLPETRAFHPHITLARSRNRTGMNTLTRLAKPALPSLGTELRWLAREVVLYRSELGREGAVYEEIERLLLEAEDTDLSCSP